MKNFNTAIFATVLFLATSVNFYSQRLANVDANSKRTYRKATPKPSFKTCLEEGTYSYKLGSDEITVSIKDGIYTEYHPNNEFIKAKIEWNSEQEYSLTILEIKKRNLPFERGLKLNTKITRIKGNRFYYKSILDGKSWTGKFEKIDDDYIVK